MTALAEQQQALLMMLFDRPCSGPLNTIANFIDGTWARGQKVYHSNGHALACSALRASYPVVAQLLGEESFDDLARALWHANPPRRGDVARWGDTLADFVRASDQLANEQYLPDVAALEWAVHTASTAADGLSDPDSFALLATHDPMDLHLILSPGCSLHPSAWPVVSIVNAHVHQNPSLSAVGKMLQAGASEVALVWRQGLRVCWREAWPEEQAFVQELLSQRTLGQALEKVPAIGIGAWLPMAVQSGLLLGVDLICTQ